MSTVTVYPRGLVTKDPSESRVVLWDWDTNCLADGVTITDSSFTITTIPPVGDTDLTYDNDAVLSGSRTTQLRLLGGTVGCKYNLKNTVVTSESPAQTKERSIVVLIEEQ